MLRNYQFIMIVIFVTSPALVLSELAPSKPTHISKIASTHPVEETIYSVTRERERERERKRERGMGSAVIAVLVCVLLDFMNPVQALGGWLGWTRRLLRDVFTPAMIT